MLMSTKQKQPEQQALPTTGQQPEEQKVEAPKPTGSAQGKTAEVVLSPFRQRLAKYFEDQHPDLTADAEADRLACQWADELEERLARYADTEGRVTGLLERQPHVAELLQQLLDDDALPLEKLSPLLPLLEQVKALDNEPPSPKRTAALRSLLVQALAKVL